LNNGGGLPFLLQFDAGSLSWPVSPDLPRFKLALELTIEGVRGVDRASLVTLDRGAAAAISN
jgi:hypothetical protein